MGGKWVATGTKEELYAKGHKEEYDSWKDKVQGDRKTQLVIIGSGLDVKGIRQSLDDCLVSEEEYLQMKHKDRIDAKPFEGGEEEDPFRPAELEDEWEDEKEDEKAEEVTA